jgi:lipoate---protein ligase
MSASRGLSPAGAATIRTVGSAPLPTPSEHARSLAGLDLVLARPPLVRVEAAREVVVVVSRSRAPEREIFLERCAADGVPVVVRPSGGGAVVLSPGVVAASAVLPADPAARFPEPYFRRCCGAVAAALGALGVPGVEMRGTSDLCLGDRKLAGSSLRLAGGRVLFQVSVLVDPDLGLLDRYLRHPSREPGYRAGRSHAGFVTSLRRAGCAAAVGDVIAALDERLRGEARLR